MGRERGGGGGEGLLTPHPHAPTHPVCVRRRSLCARNMRGRGAGGGREGLSMQQKLPLAPRLLWRRRRRRRPMERRLGGRGARVRTRAVAAAVLAAAWACLVSVVAAQEGASAAAAAAATDPKAAAPPAAVGLEDEAGARTAGEGEFSSAPAPAQPPLHQQQAGKATQARTTLPAAAGDPGHPDAAGTGEMSEAPGGTCALLSWIDLAETTCEAHEEEGEAAAASPTGDTKEGDVGAARPVKPRVGLEDFKRAKVEILEQHMKRKAEEAAAAEAGHAAAAAAAAAAAQNLEVAGGTNGGGSGDEGSTAEGTTAGGALSDAGEAAPAAPPPPAPPPRAGAYTVPTDDAGRVNYASSLNGASVLAANADAKSKSALVTDSRDQYMISPCSSTKWFILELSAEVIVDTLVLGNYEVYSGTVREFEVWGSQIQVEPSDPRWEHLSTLEASKSKQKQRFVLEGNERWSRYLLIKMNTHWGTESYCTLTSIKVFGRDAIENLRHEMEGMSAEMEEFNKLIHEQEGKQEKSDEDSAAPASAGLAAPEGAVDVATENAGPDFSNEAAADGAAEDASLGEGEAVAPTASSVTNASAARNDVVAPANVSDGDTQQGQVNSSAGEGGVNAVTGATMDASIEGAGEHAVLPHQDAQQARGGREGEAESGIEALANETAAASAGERTEAVSPDPVSDGMADTADAADPVAEPGTVLGQLASALKGLVAETSAPPPADGESPSSAVGVANMTSDEKVTGLSASVKSSSAPSELNATSSSMKADDPDKDTARVTSDVEAAHDAGADAQTGASATATADLPSKADADHPHAQADAQAEASTQTVTSTPTPPPSSPPSKTSSLKSSPAPSSNQPASTSGPVQPGASTQPLAASAPRTLQNEQQNVFKALITRIKNLEVNSSIFETYVEESNSDFEERFDFLEAQQTKIDTRCANATLTLVASAEHYARMESKRASEEARLREAVMVAAERRLSVLALEVARAEAESARLALAAFVSSVCACLAVAALIVQRHLEQSRGKL